MPKMNGFELYDKLKKIDNKVKVCFLTAFGEGYYEEFKERFQMYSSSSSNISFVRKPIRIDDLVKEIRSKLDY